MRENRPHGSEGGGAEIIQPSLPLGLCGESGPRGVYSGTEHEQRDGGTGTCGPQQAMSPQIPVRLIRQVRQRAGDVCESCRRWGQASNEVSQFTRETVVVRPPPSALSLLL